MNMHTPADAEIAASIAAAFGLSVQRPAVTNERERRIVYVAARGWTECKHDTRYFVKDGVTNEYGQRLLSLEEAYWLEVERAERQRH